MTALARFDGGEIGWPGQTVLQDLTLTLRTGERVALLGRSGAGKSTLLGAIRAQIEAAGPRLALVPQDHGLVGQLSVQHNVWMGVLDDHSTVQNLANLVRPSARARAAVAPWLEAVGLAGLDRRSVETLSGGQRQRTALARAFYRDFEVLLLDDVMSAVDHGTEKKLIEALYRRAAGRTTLIVSHRLSVLARAQRVIVLDGGKLVDQGTHTELLQRPGPYARTWQLQQAQAEAEAIHE